MSERVFERANQCCGVEGSLVHQARAVHGRIPRSIVDQ